MNWTIPPSWVSVERAAFDRIVNQREYSREGWYGVLVYHDLATTREFAAIEELNTGNKYWVHPDMIDA